MMWRVLVLMVGVLLSSLSAVGAPNLRRLCPTNEVLPELWTTNFPGVLKAAEAQGRPILMFAGSGGCGHCRRLEHRLEGRSFRKWIEGTGIYLAEAHFGVTNQCPEQKALVDFVIKSFPEYKNQEFPYIGVYWAGGTNGVVRRAFSARREEMPGKHEDFLGQVLDSVEGLLKEYLVRQDAYVSVDEALRRGAKKIEIVAEGEGSVSMRPESGLLYEDGKSVELMARAAKDVKMIELVAPSGRVVQKTRCGWSRLLRYTVREERAEEGVYKAVFKKNEKK